MTGSDAGSGSGYEQPFDITDSDQETSGGMGVSSETEDEHGHTTGTRDVSPPTEADAAADAAADAEADQRPEQSSGGDEVKPDPPIPPKSGYNSHDPASADEPYDAPPMI